MSKVLLINGSPNEFGCTYTALSEISAVLNKNGVETELLYLGKKPIAGCSCACVRGSYSDAFYLSGSCKYYPQLNTLPILCG